VIQTDYKLIFSGQGGVCDATSFCLEPITLTSERRGSPAKLNFKVTRHTGLSFFEGDQVSFYADDTPMFLGYVFKKSRDKEQLIDVTAYDQMRYLKNKDTYVYQNKTAAQALRMVADDFGLALGDVADTGYVIPYRVEDIQTLMDIICNALDLTLINTGELFVLYDDFGRLTLKNIRDMRLEEVISAEYKLIDYDYRTDIDADTANKVKLVRDNKESGVRDAYIEMDSGNIGRWGVLQIHEKVDENWSETQIIQRARQLLKNSNRVKRSLSVDNLNGDLRVRGGSSLYVNIPNLGDISVNKILVVSKCEHTFGNNEHRMSLELEGLE
jgi:hypothetical protein